MEVVILENEPIKIGRVSRAIEKAVDKSFTCSCFVFVKEEHLNALAKAYPTTYLRRIEGIGELIKDASFASFDKDSKTLVVIKDYIKNGVFSLFGVNLTPIEIGWEASDIFRVTEEKALAINAKGEIHPIA